MFLVNFLFLALLLQIFENTQSKVIKFEEIPISAGDLTVRFVANKDRSTGDVGKLVIILRENEETEQRTKAILPASDPSFIPDLVDKTGIIVGNCPSGWKRIGVRCVNKP